VTYDAEVKPRERIWETSLTEGILRDFIQNVRTKRLIVIMDACYSNGAYGQIAGFLPEGGKSLGAGWDEGYGRSQRDMAQRLLGAKELVLTGPSPPKGWAKILISASDAGLSQTGSVGMGDDAAVVTVDAGRQLVITVDTMVAGVHFPIDTPAADIACKALAVNLSDLAAMGADPRWFFLALTLPQADERWLEEFATGLATLAAASGIELAGGDTTSGPLSITITALGVVNRGEALLRSTAQAGDLVVVSGTPGLAAAGLMQWRAGEAVDSQAWRAFTRPQPRLQLGRALHGKATACIDVSDGLAADLGQRAAIGFGPGDLVLARFGELGVHRRHQRILQVLDPQEDRRMARGHRELDRLLRPRGRHGPEQEQAGDRSQCAAQDAAIVVSSIHFEVLPDEPDWIVFR